MNTDFPSILAELQKFWVDYAAWKGLGLSNQPVTLNKDQLKVLNDTFAEMNNIMKCCSNIRFEVAKEETMQ